VGQSIFPHDHYAFWRECPTSMQCKRHDPRRAFGSNNRHEYVTWVTDGGNN
jgi:hypothetical protein